MVLNTINAERYVTEYIVSAELAGAMVQTAFVQEWNDDSSPAIIHVPFTWEGHEYAMDVWVESDGSLYGEW